ncbi:SF0329 family protein [Desemzia incerta]|uniref:SF0329 family protein n=1 Tax=Desemzia incerta TaxID=82801 RepID=UPI003D039BF1
MPDQQWSKLRKRIENLICESLRERVKFTVTNYRKAHDQLGRAFISVDKNEVFNMCTLTSNNTLFEKEEELLNDLQLKYDVFNEEQNCSIQDKAHEIIMTEGVFAQYDFFEAVEQYLNSSIEVSLQSNHIIIKILSLIDRRVGKRTLKRIKESIQQEHEIVQFFYTLRCEAERIG